jgi:hypothetical protein
MGTSEYGGLVVADPASPNAPVKKVLPSHCEGNVRKRDCYRTHILFSFSTTFSKPSLDVAIS